MPHIYKRFFILYNLHYVIVLRTGGDRPVWGNFAGVCNCGMRRCKESFKGMASEFSRIITLLRKERGITQKKAAEALGVSQALLSHYEKGIRECGLEFVVKVANFYNVSCDYLLGRSADRSGLTLNVEDIPAPDSSAAKDGHFRGSVLPTLNRKLVSNSLNILYDKLNACPDKALVGEISAYLMMAVYKMFRLVYRSAPKNAASMFSVPESLWRGYSGGAMSVAEANVAAILKGEDLGAGSQLKDTSAFAMTTESITKEYPLYATSLFNLIKTSEQRIGGSKEKDKKAK